MTPADRVEISDLVHRYAAYVDDRDLDAAAALFALDGVLVPPDRGAGPVPAAGRAAVRKALGRLARVDATLHEVTGEVVDRTGPHAAEGRVTARAHHVTAGVDHVWHLVYRDSYRRLDGRWRFDRRALEIVFTEERKVTTPGDGVP